MQDIGSQSVVNQKPKVLRRKKLPYAANGYLENTRQSVREAQRCLTVAIESNCKGADSSAAIARASHYMSLAITNLVELQLIQNQAEE